MSLTGDGTPAAVQRQTSNREPCSGAVPARFYHPRSCVI